MSCLVVVPAVVEGHTTNNHRIAGRGSDLRPTDLDVQVTCTNCHQDKQNDGHNSADINRHVARVACQTCHIPHYGKTIPTEMHRDWRESHALSAPFLPAMTKQSDVTPVYRFYNGTSSCANLGEVAVIDAGTGCYPTSRPSGDINGTNDKLYAFKYKTASQPMTINTSQLVALDTSFYFASGDATGATRQGLTNMGFSENEPYAWIKTDTYQMLNHQVSPSSHALQCNECHGQTTRMDLKGKLGYELKSAKSTVCSQCHRDRNASFEEVHREHVRGEGYDCSRCHKFSRPERNFR